MRSWALSGKKEFQDFLEMIRSVDATPYDLAGDPRGELVWRGLAATLAEAEPFKVNAPIRLDIDGVVVVVEQIIKQFQFLIEDRRHH